MRSIAKRVVAATAKSNALWPVYRACRTLGTWLTRLYVNAAEARYGAAIEPVRPWLAAPASSRENVIALVERIVPDLVVANGPFRGMRYADAESAGSELLPKLIGSYESELHPVIERILGNEYARVIDIGCAEGYYAVGLAMRLPNVKVMAFDTDPNARRLCTQMARLNGVSERVSVGGTCDEAVLLSLDLGERALIVADCEGFEKTLFSDRVVQFLKRHDVLIETHDFGDIEDSPVLRARFAATHDIAAIDSVDDLRKVRHYCYPQLEGLDAATRLVALAERRPAIMEWLFMTPRRA